MADRGSARLLAPLALVAFLVVLLFVISSSGAGSGSGSDGAARSTSVQGAGAPGDAAAPGGRSSYEVKPGDLLSGISEETGVPVSRIQELNPGIDPQALRVGQKLKLSG